MALARPPASADPKRRPGLAVIIGMGKPKDDRPGGPQPASTPPSQPVPAPNSGGQPAPQGAATPPAMPGGGNSPSDESTPAGGSEAIPPEKVSAHGEDQKCTVCEYMLPDSSCSWLKLPVGPGTAIGWCMLFEAKGGEPDADDSMPGAMLAISPGAPPNA